MYGIVKDVVIHVVNKAMSKGGNLIIADFMPLSDGVVAKFLRIRESVHLRMVDVFIFVIFCCYEVVCIVIAQNLGDSDIRFLSFAFLLRGR